jgi:hypothetical protein
MHCDKCWEEECICEKSGDVSGKSKTTGYATYQRIKQLEDAIKTCVSKFNCIRLGYDGDCGSQNIIDDLEDELEQND